MDSASSNNRATNQHHSTPQVPQQMQSSKSSSSTLQQYQPNIVVMQNSQPMLNPSPFNSIPVPVIYSMQGMPLNLKEGGKALSQKILQQMAKSSSQKSSISHPYAMEQQHAVQQQNNTATAH